MIYVAVFLVLVLGFLAFTAQMFRSKTRLERSYARIGSHLRRKQELLSRFLQVDFGLDNVMGKELSSQVKGVHEGLTEKIVAENQLNRSVNMMTRKWKDGEESDASKQFNTEWMAIEHDAKQIRAAFNKEIKAYNTSLSSIPSRYLAPLFNFKVLPIFDS